MKHSLPWNVNGIPPEAREIARSAAQREGATVGEWLTRRIMTEAVSKAAAADPTSQLTPPFRSAHEGELPRPADSASRAPRTETPSDPAVRRIDEAFRSLARRLENNERAQAEAQLAMNAAAAEINAATRDQAQAFQHLTSRIERAERHADTGALRDAIRGLHQGLSRLADGIAKSHNESFGKFTALSGAVEMLAGKMASVEDESNSRFQAVEEKLASLDARVTHNAERFEQTEERIASASRLDETVTALEQRIDAVEQRVQESLGHYLAGIERGLGQIGEHLQRAEEHGRSDGGIEEAVRSLTARFEAMQNNEGRAAAEPDSAPGEIVESPTVESTMAVEGAAPANVAVPDEPPMAGDTPAEFSLTSTSDEALFMHAPDTVRVGEYAPRTSVPPDEGPTPTAPPAHAATENYLAHARRAARAVSDPASDRHSMRSRIRPEAAESGERRRMLRSLAAGLLVVLLVGAGAVLTRSNQSSASALTLPRSNLIALDIPRSGNPSETSLASASAPVPLPAPQPGASQPAAPSVADTVAAASVFPLGDAGTTPLVLLMAKANSGDAKAEMALGLKYADGDGVAVNETQAAYWLQKAAEAGQAVAQYRLGTLYERGRGVTADTSQALRWYGEAANHGNRRAMHNLGVVYADGAGTEKNFLEAARWFKDAAELGLTDSQFNLAVLYERGLGVKASLTEAYKWYAIAAAAGDAESKARVTALANQIAPADRNAADKAAKAYRPRPIDVAANEG